MIENLKKQLKEYEAEKLKLHSGNHVNILLEGFTAGAEWAVKSVQKVIDESRLNIEIDLQQSDFEGDSPTDAVIAGAVPRNDMQTIEIFNLQNEIISLKHRIGDLESQVHNGYNKY